MLRGYNTWQVYLFSLFLPDSHFFLSKFKYDILK